MKLAGIFAASAVCLAAMSSGAVAVERANLTNGTGICQGALPNFEGQLRKRPTAISNEGTSNAFISCSTTQDLIASESASQLGVIFNNKTNAAATVNCAMVEGLQYFGIFTPTLYPKSFVVPAGGSLEDGWDADTDNGGDAFFPSLNVSCNLPVGVELASAYIYIAEDGSAPATPPGP